MKFTITGSLGNIGNPLVQNLVNGGHEVTVISSNSDRKSEIQSLGAKAAIGSVTDTDFLTSAFTGADAVYTMSPPNMGGSDIIANMTKVGKAFVEAIRKSGTTRVVLLSSIGADVQEGTGPIAGLYQIEQLYNQLEGVSITFLRAGYFYTNFYNDIPMIKGMNIMGSNFSETTNIPLVHPADIAVAITEELQKVTSGKNVRYIISSVKTPAEISKTIGAAIGKPDLPWVEFTDEQSIEGMLQAGLSREIAGLYTEMGNGLRNGIIPADFFNSKAPVTGQIKLEEFAKEFAGKFSI